LARDHEAEHGLNPIVHVMAQVGGAARRGMAGADTRDADLVGSISIELIDPDLRPYSSFAFVADLQDRVPRLPLTEELSFRGVRSGPGDDALDMALYGAAAEALKTRLARYPEVSALEDNLAWDKAELVLDLTPHGQALGFSIDDLGRTLRNRVNGIEAATYPDGPRSAAIRVELPDTDLSADFLETMQLRSASGQYVPLADIVTVTTRTGFATVRRERGLRHVNVTGDISEDDPERAAGIMRLLEAEILPRIAGTYQVEYRIGGLSEQESDFIADARLGLMLTLLGIYLMLALVFASWTPPMVVMAVIPFGLVGAIWGHVHWDVPLSMFSVVGLLGMVGIIINDSIVLVASIDDHARRRGLVPAIIEGTADRRRPVLLTTLTTVLGLAPLLFERSTQAQFLKPTVVTLVYGLGFGTVLVLSRRARAHGHRARSGAAMGGAAAGLARTGGGIVAARGGGGAVALVRGHAWPGSGHGGLARTSRGAAPRPAGGCARAVPLGQRGGHRAAHGRHGDRSRIGLAPVRIWRYPCAMRILSDDSFAAEADRGASCAIGNFDGVHLGHRAVIELAREAGERIGAPLGIVTFEPHPREFFAPDAPPFRLTNAEARAHRLEELGVERLYQLPFNAALAALTPRAFAQEVLADGLGLAHIVVGEDFCFGKGRAGNAAMLQEFGAEMGFGVTIAPLVEDDGRRVSSTAIRQALTEGRPRDAAAMLGHWHRIEGPVLAGERRGRALGYPTANMSIAGLHPPRFGIYAVLVDVLGGPHKGHYHGAASLGVRPMFGGEVANLETFLFDFSGDLYGTHLSVGLVEYLRPEATFESLDAFIAQMDADCARARTILAAL